MVLVRASRTNPVDCSPASCCFCRPGTQSACCAFSGLFRALCLSALVSLVLTVLPGSFVMGVALVSVASYTFGAGKERFHGIELVFWCSAPAEGAAYVEQQLLDAACRLPVPNFFYTIVGEAPELLRHRPPSAVGAACPWPKRKRDC